MIKPGVKAGKYNTDNIELTVSLGVYHEILSNVQIYSDYVTVCLSVHWRMFPKQGSALCHAQPDPGHRSCLPYGSPHRYLPRRQTAPKLLQQSITYTYSLYKDYSTFPLTSGDGTYQVGVYENVSDDRYTTLLSETFSVTLTDPLKPYLYPNQYVNFTADFLPVAKAEELADGASSDLDIISSVYNYIITHTTRTLLHISTILNHYMLGFIIAFLVLLIICMILYHTDLGRVLFLGQKLAMTVASGRVPNCLYLVLSSGLDSNIGLTLARELVNNPHMQALIDKCHENIRHGESFDKALLLSGIFSQMYASWIVIGSRTGEMESIVSQREINTDTASYLTALRAALRQINGIIYTSAAENMIAMDSSILQLYKDGRIDKHTAISEAVNPEIMSKRLNLL